MILEVPFVHIIDAIIKNSSVDKLLQFPAIEREAAIVHPRVDKRDTERSKAS